MKYNMDKIKGYWILRNKFILGGVIIFLSPFIGIQIYEFNNVLGIFPLLDFGLPLKDFFTVWISLWGVIGVVITLFLSHKRLSSYEKTEQNNRFAKAIELLGNSHASTRSGGAIYLSSLAIEYPGSFKQEIFDILCSHIRYTTNNEEYKRVYAKRPSDEVQILIELLFKKKDGNDFIFKDCRANLVDCFLNGANLEKARIVRSNFENSSLDGTILSDCNIEASRFKNTTFKNCELNRTRFDFSTFYECSFEEINDMPSFNFSFFKKGKFSNWNIGDAGCDFRGAKFEEIIFDSVSILEGNFTASIFHKCSIYNNSVFEDCYILGVDYSTSSDMKTILINPQDRAYGKKKEDIANFEHPLNPLVISNVDRYNRVLNSKGIV